MVAIHTNNVCNMQHSAFSSYCFFKILFPCDYENIYCQSLQNTSYYRLLLFSLCQKLYSTNLLPLQKPLASHVVFTLDYLVLKPERNNVKELLCPTLSDIRNSTALFQGSQDLLVCHSDKSIILMKLKMEHWSKGTERG